MATTTNFGWETPDDTDLVKDGALAIRTLGSAIDTSLVDLKGGTTGQVLSKTSNTDMDFTWVTSDDANAIQNAIVDAKGDLIAASAADTPARLAVGNNGETLVADSSTSTGLRYTAGNAVGNPVLNSAFQVWQRGTSFSTTAGYTADRWYAANNPNTTYSRQTTSDTTNLPNIQYSLRMQRTAGATATDGSNILQNFETVNSIPYAGKTVTLSFYARAGANLSSTFSAILITGTGTDQNAFVGAGFTGSATPISQNASVTTTWQRFSFTGTIATTATQLAIQFYKANSGTAGAADWVEVTGVQIDLGSVALPFRTYAATLAGELVAAQRYYVRCTGDLAYSNHGFGLGTSTTNARIQFRLPSQMRVVPTSVDYANLAVFDGATVTAVTSLGLVANTSSYLIGNIDCGVASGLTQYRPYSLINNNNTGGYVGFSAEL